MIRTFFWDLGYHLRRCSYCNRPRLFRRGDPSRPHPDDMTREELQERFDRKIRESLGRMPRASEMSESKMAVESSNGPKGPEIRTVGTSVGVAEKPVVVAEKLVVVADKPVVVAEKSVGVAEKVEPPVAVPCCPYCGGTHYRRSRRRWWERLMKRPRMARCRRCIRRFPYPD